MENYQTYLQEEMREGERRINRIRVISLIAFYLIEHIRFYQLHLVPPVTHLWVSSIVGIWIIEAGIFYIIINRKSVLYRWMKYTATVFDIGFITLVILIGGGPSSDLIVLYYLLIVSSGLRYQSRSVWRTMLGCMLGYAILNVFCLVRRPYLLVPPFTAITHILTMLLLGLLTALISGRLLFLLQRFIRMIAERDRIEKVFGRYVSKPVMEKLLAQAPDAFLTGEQIEITTLFSDLREFTALSENYDAKLVFRWLNEYFETMIEVVFALQGTVDKFVGDAILVAFGTPLSQDDHARRAVQTAWRMQEALAALNIRRQRDREPILSMGIGVNTGLAIAGSIGSKQRTEYTIIGDAVNTCQRLGALALPKQILIARPTYERVKEIVEVIEHPPLLVKGKVVPVSYYEMTGLIQPVSI